MNTPRNNPTAPDPLAVELAKLEPVPHGLEWNALMFSAGQASKARALNYWRMAAGVCALAACGFAFLYFSRPVIVREYPAYPAAGPATARPHPPVTLPVPQSAAPGLATPQPQRLQETSPVQGGKSAPNPPRSEPEPLKWAFEPPPERGSAARWLKFRNEVLTVGPSLLPDHGHAQLLPPRGER